jgi:outer membrane protein OmpA-like peptidoglycan-associated protein
MKALRWTLAIVVAVAVAMPCAARADEGLIAGVDIGAAIPVGETKDRLDTGGALSPFAGYMFNDVFGLMGQLQVAGFPNDDRPGIRDQDATWVLGGHVGPRIGLPFSIGGLGLEPFGTFQAGVFTGLVGDTPVSRTSWGYSTGGGLNVRLNDDWLIGAFGRYNNVDQRVTPGNNVEYVTAGIGLTYNMAAAEAPPPAPAVAQAPPPPPPAVKKKIVLRGVNFDFNKANIRADARPILDEAIATLRKEGNVSIVAEGHTDSVGSDAYNQTLSERRAHAVKDYLVKGGIAFSRIEIVGKGESSPVATNDTDDGRAQNRRVELRVR